MYICLLLEDLYHLEGFPAQCGIVGEKDVLLAEVKKQDSEEDKRENYLLSLDEIKSLSYPCHL